MAAGRAAPDHLLRDERAVPDWPAARPGSSPATVADLSGAAHARARPARRCRRRASPGCTSASPPTCCSARVAGAPTCARPSCSRTRCCRCAPARSRRAALGAAVAAVRRGRQAGRRRGRRARPDPAAAVDAAALLGRRRRDPLHEAYFDDYPGVWRHGDWIKLTTAGGVVIHGRSDSTLNRGGVRIGTAEFYRVVEELPGGRRQPGRRHRRARPRGGPAAAVRGRSRDGSTARRRAARPARSAIRSELSPAARPGRDRSPCPRSPARSTARSSRCPSSGCSPAPVREGGLARRGRQPGRARALRGAGAPVGRRPAAARPPVATSGRAADVAPSRRGRTCC